jgi:hypothetical protein
MAKVREVLPEERQNLFQSIKEWFGELDKFTKSFLIVTLLIIISVSALGSYITLRNYASTVDSFLTQAESGNLTGNAVLGTDTAASGGQYIQFGQAISSTGSFVTRSGNKLMLNGKEFRFSGANIYWLGISESNEGSVNGIHYPPHFTVDDALATAKEMGATVVRSHTLGDSSTDSTLNNCPSSICLATGVDVNGNVIFNDSAFTSIDYAIGKASQDGLRLVVPFTDGNTPCFYEGCIRNFINWVDPSLPNSAFFTDSRVINKFEQYINHILNHKISTTGNLVKDEPTIMAWESGNEMDDQSPNATWLTTISQYVKSIDSKHLFIDGGWTMDSTRLNTTTIDIYTRHHYHGGYYGTGAITDDNYYGCKAAAANKVYFAGEYDWTEHTGTPLTLSTYLPHVENDTCSDGSHAVAGDLYWSLFPHRDTYGFVLHGDPYTLHYTGDPRLTTPPTIWTQTQLLRTHAYNMQGVATPPSLVPAPPTNIKLTNSSGIIIQWSGSVAANSYTIQRSADNITWSTINSTVDDNGTPWTDTGVTSGATYYYRVQAVNRNGVGGTFSPSVSTTGASTPTPTNTPIPTSSCSVTVPTNTGTDTLSVSNVPSTGTYNTWIRMMVPASGNSVYYQVKDASGNPVGCPQQVVDSTTTPGQWDWVPQGSVTLATGQNYSVVLIGNQTGVKVDELLFSQTCTPIGDGSSCIVASPTPTPTPTPIAPTPTPTPTPIAPTPTPTPTPTPGSGDKTPPTVSITNPVNGATVAKNSTITIAATATDNVAVAKVLFYVNGKLSCTDTVKPYTCNWRVAGKSGAIYTLSAQAFDTSNNNATAVVNVTSK